MNKIVQAAVLIASIAASPASAQVIDYTVAALGGNITYTGPTLQDSLPSISMARFSRY